MARDGATGRFVLSTSVVPVSHRPRCGKGIESIERSARHCGTPVFGGAGTVPAADPGHPEDAGHHDHGSGLRLPQPAD